MEQILLCNALCSGSALRKSIRIHFRHYSLHPNINRERLKLPKAIKQRAFSDLFADALYLLELLAAAVNLLIADDVGLGKTIEAGLVIQELLLRHRARTVLIVCPASLQEKWRVEMLEKFGLDFRVVDTDYIKQLRRERGIHANPWTSHPRLITSMDWAKGGEGLRAMRDVIPPHVGHPRKFDLLVVELQ